MILLLTKKAERGLYKFTISTRQHAGNGLFIPMFTMSRGRMTGLTGTSYQVDQPQPPRLSQLSTHVMRGILYPHGHVCPEQESTGSLKERSLTGATAANGQLAHAALVQPNRKHPTSRSHHLLDRWRLWAC